MRSMFPWTRFPVYNVMNYSYLPIKGLQREAIFSAETFLKFHLVLEEISFNK